jgi:demethylmenaquinone methyltransferase / 2-methoxy-6-polyprenyl-1,4-benzoquinol methylase
MDMADNEQARTGIMVMVPPHPVLAAHYGTAEARGAFVRTLFDDTASIYDRLNGLLSFGSGGWYRSRALRQAGLRPGMRVLDVATGTGLVAREARRIAGNGVIGLDLSFGMLTVAARVSGPPLVQGRAESLPVADGSIDFVSMGYALRHVPDLLALAREFHRVLRPGGTVLLLEIGRPGGRIGTAFAHAYLGYVVPALSALLGGARARGLMRYYWDTIAACVPPETILESLRGGGFGGVGCATQLGIFRAYTGRRP